MDRIHRAIARARVALLVEAFWPRLVVALCVVALFLIASWFGLWGVLPDLLRFALVGLLGLSALAAFIWAARAPRPRSGEALARVETASDLDGRPLQALLDKPFDGGSPESQALWAIHQERVAGALKRLRAGRPNPRTDHLDRWALRAPIVLVLIVAFFVAGPQREERILEAFAPPSSAPTVPIRLDVWATPPAYTGLPPRTLVAGAELGAGSPQADGADLLVDNLAASLPVGSRLTILSSAPDQVSAQLRPIDGSAPTEATRTSETSATATASASAASSLDVTVEEDAVLHIDAGGAQIEIPIISILDEPPAIQFEEEPSTTPAGAMVLSYIAADDYGIMQAQAVIERADLADGEATDAPREEPLIAAPSFDLTLPSGVGGSVSMTRDLTAHPWAGARVELSLQAADGREQIGRSRTLTIDLPARPFSDPLALGVAEQRRILALDPRQRTSVLTMLEAFALGPELFMEDDYSTFLGLTVTTQRLRLADTRDELIEIVDMLWQLALTIQDGDLAAAAERLRQAEQALADALENGASDEEIAQLMDELRNALQDYMQGLAQQMQGLDPSQLNQQLSTQSLDPQSMQSMMDQIEQLSQMGAEDAARQMLDQLRQQLDALRGAQAMQPREPTPEEQELREALQQLQSITREQQRLMDETFPFSQDAQAPQLRRPFDRLTPNPDTNPGERDMGRGPDRPAEENSEGGEQGSDPQNPLDGLSAEQQALREQLEALMDQLSDLGLDPSQMGEAGDAMDGAGQMLGRGSAQGALPEQGRALEALRQGAQDLAQQLAGDGDGQGQGEGQAQGQGQSPGQQGGMPRLLFAPGQGQQGFDPLGRPQRAPRAQSGERVGIPEESDIQRARDILNEIQRRLGERSRPQPELDYLDRLIERF